LEEQGGIECHRLVALELHSGLLKTFHAVEVPGKRKGQKRKGGQQWTRCPELEIQAQSKDHFRLRIQKNNIRPRELELWRGLYVQADREREDCVECSVASKS
jgi:hypothetical protein